MHGYDSIRWVRVCVACTVGMSLREGRTRSFKNVVCPCRLAPGVVWLSHISEGGGRGSMRCGCGGRAAARPGASRLGRGSLFPGNYTGRLSSHIASLSSHIAERWEEYGGPVHADPACRCLFFGLVGRAHSEAWRDGTAAPCGRTECGRLRRRHLPAIRRMRSPARSVRAAIGMPSAPSACASALCTHEDRRNA